MGWLTSIWNFVVSIAPTVFHTACELTQGASDILKVGGGS